MKGKNGSHFNINLIGAAICQIRIHYDIHVQFKNRIHKIIADDTGHKEWQRKKE